ncbi:MAG: nucleotidyltransferase family protein [Phycisphaerae bacterium]|nr:nucleotidyltransferase family protein [Phycisphaerae bacterium]
MSLRPTTSRPVAIPPPTARCLPLLRAVVRGDSIEAARIAGEMTSPEAEAWARYVIGQQLAHTVLWRASGRLDILPAAALPGLVAERERTAARDRALVRATRDAISALSAAGLGSMVLKGTPLAERYYGEATARRTADADILVRWSDTDRALAVLMDLGFGPKARRVRETSVGPAVDRHTLATDHAFALARDDARLDLHWCLRRAPGYRIAEDSVWAGALRVDGAAGPCAVPSDEHTLTLLCISIAEDIARGACRLKHLMDVRQWLVTVGASADWPGLLARRRPERTEVIVLNVLALVLDVLGEPPRSTCLKDAIEAARDRIRHRSQQDAVDLVHTDATSPRGSLWFARVYPVNLRRDVPWVLRRDFGRVRNWYTSAYRAARFAVRMAWYGLSPSHRRTADPNGT